MSDSHKLYSCNFRGLDRPAEGQPLDQLALVGLGVEQKHIGSPT